jgi:CheY-like chemotaxis protein
MHLARYDLNELISTFVTILRRTIRENIEIHEDLSSDACLIFADRSQTEQILLNLAVNAQDAIKDNGAITIQTGHVVLDDEYCRAHPEVRPGRYVMMDFSDNGSGMDEETLSHIFEPFFTTKPVGIGTGLGLSTVYGIVKQHEGFIGVESRVGIGTTFKIYLPEATAPDHEVTPQVEEVKGASDAAGVILLVEDNAMVREVTKDLLEMHGHTVLVAETPEKALAIAAENRDSIDLLVTDIVMPEMNGIELHRRLHEMIPDLKVLFISGYADIGRVHEGVLDAKVNFLPKPFTSEGILKRISELLI